MFSVKLSINNHIVSLVHENHIILTCLMYHAACKVEFQPFKRSHSQLTFFNFLYNGTPVHRVLCHGRTELTQVPGTGVNECRTFGTGKISGNYPGYAYVRTTQNTTLKGASVTPSKQQCHCCQLVTNQFFYALSCASRVCLLIVPVVSLSLSCGHVETESCS